MEEEQEREWYVQKWFQSEVQKQQQQRGALRGKEFCIAAAAVAVVLVHHH